MTWDTRNIYNTIRTFVIFALFCHSFFMTTILTTTNLPEIPEEVVLHRDTVKYVYYHSEVVKP